MVGGTVVLGHRQVRGKLVQVGHDRPLVRPGSMLAPLVRLFAGRLIGRYVDMEARGLKQRSEREDSPSP